MLDVEFWNPETLKPEILKWWSHILSRKPESLNPEMLVPRSFHNFGNYLCSIAFHKFVHVEVGYWNSQSFEPRNLEMRVSPFPFLFSEICVCRCLDTRNCKVPNPKILKYGTNLSFFTFQRFVYVVVWALALAKSRILKPKNVGHSRSIFQISANNKILCFVRHLYSPKPDWPLFLHKAIAT